MALQIGGGPPAASRRARPRDLDLRALHRDRPRHHQRQPALGEQHPDHQRRDARRRRHRDRLPGRRQRLGQRHRGVAGAGDRPRRGRRPGSRAWPTPPRTAPSWSPATRPATGRTRPATTSIQVFDDVRRRSSATPSVGPTPSGASSTASSSTRSTTTYLGSSTGLRLRHVQPTGHYGCTGKNAELTNSAWVGGATRDFADVDAEQMAVDLATRLSWGERRLDLPAGRYDTILPPTSVADMMIYAYWSAGARNADDGQHACSPSRAAAPGSARRSSAPASGCTPTRRTPACECAPFVIAGGSSDRSSVYDNGLPLGPTDWIADGRLTSLIQTRHTADAHRPADDPGHRQPRPRRRRRLAAPRPTSSPVSTTGCC